MQQAIPYKPIKLPGSGGSATTTSTDSSSSSSHPISTVHLFPSSPSEFIYKISDTRSNQHHAAAAAVMIKNMVVQNPVIVIGRRGCCMGHVVKCLLLSLGVNPAVHEVDDDREEKSVSEELVGCGSLGSGEELQFPAVFIGGRLFGGLETVMAAHISGELTPILKEAGALWL